MLGDNEIKVIRDYVRKLLSEQSSSVKDEEKQYQEKVAKSLGRLSEDDSEAGTDVSSKTVQDDTSDSTQEITSDQIIEYLNSIRSGKSFRDEGVRTSFDQYFNSLKKIEKVALLAFLRGISQIMTNEIDVSTASSPHKSPPDIAMKKLHKVTVKPNIVKRETTNNPATEPAVPSAPIRVKKK